MSKQKQYYVFARPNGMEDHKFTDDVALCKASNFREAKKIFSQYYAEIKDEEISPILPKKSHKSAIWILTDY